MSEVTLNPLECALDEAQTFRSQADALRAENAKLRETLQRRNEQFEGMTEMWVERGVENSKLRELVRDMWHLLFDWLFKSHEVPWKELEAVHDRMRELGAEVNE